MTKVHKYGTNIPQARIKLLKIASNLEAMGHKVISDEIKCIIDKEMTRRPGPRRAAARRDEVTPKTIAAVRNDLVNTDLPQEEIARKYNIDGGRVSEIYRGMRN